MWTRRSVLKQAGVVGFAWGAGLPFIGRGWGQGKEASTKGILVGEPTSERVANQVFAEGGNAIDAIIAGALAAAVAAPHQTGIGGYGASGIIGLAGNKRIVALDANSAAPQSMTPSMFAKDASARAEMMFGWKSAGVPGILAGLQRLRDEFGTKSIAELLEPAISICRTGYPFPEGFAKTLAGAAKQLGADPGSRRLYFRSDRPLQAGEVFTNQELGELLNTLAKANSLTPFYRGDIARRIAEGFQKNGGLVTYDDMNGYEARLVEPLRWTMNEQTVYTPPLTAGGCTVLQTLRLLQSLGWPQIPEGVEWTMSRIEAMRFAWNDRLTLLGDPDHSKVPQDRLLSEAYANESAEKIRRAVAEKRPLIHPIDPRQQTGTIHLSAMDRDGNFAALTLTHGGSYGSRVTVDGLGLTLGHGMSRFEAEPTHPNAPGPRKRPLHNMVPTLVSRDGEFLMAAGGRGGRKIPNALLELLIQTVMNKKPLREGIRSPRIHTEGSLHIEFEPSFPSGEMASMKELGYRVTEASSATISAVAKEPEWSQGMR